MAFLDSERKFQIKYVLIVIFVVGLVSIIIGGGIYYTIKTEVSYRLPDVSEQGLTTSIIFSGVNNFLIVLVPVLFIIVVIVSILLLSRIASPVSRVIKELQALGKGDFTVEVEKRSGEELADLIKVVNESKENLSRMIVSEKELIDKILVIANDLLKECDKEKINKEKVLVLIKKMQLGLDKVQIALSRYRINK
ncbi:MAG: HAMP domain-containing protein [Candidatus Firestonebacteria bacterium]